MYLIMLIFIILAAMFIASGANNMITVGLQRPWRIILIWRRCRTTGLPPLMRRRPSVSKTFQGMRDMP